MSAPSVSESVLEDLAAIRPTFKLVWNPLAKPVEKGDFDRDGHGTLDAFEPRWELWDTDAEGATYRVCTLQGPEGEFRKPDRRLIDTLNLVNPARYGGDVGRMILAVADDQNQRLKDMAEEDSDDLIEMATKWYMEYAKPKVRVAADPTKWEK